MRGVIDRKGEQFAYLQGDAMFTLAGEPTGYLRGEFVEDLSGKRIWQVVGDGLYSLDGSETIGFLSGGRPSKFDY